jgi:hypothetical protein
LKWFPPVIDACDIIDREACDCDSIYLLLFICFIFSLFCLYVSWVTFLCSLCVSFFILFFCLVFVFSLLSLNFYLILYDHWPYWQSKPELTTLHTTYTVGRINSVAIICLIYRVRNITAAIASPLPQVTMTYRINFFYLHQNAGHIWIRSFRIRWLDPYVLHTHRYMTHPRYDVAFL